MLQRQLFKGIVSGIDILDRMGKFHYGLIHGVMICGKIWIRRSECILIISCLFLEFKFEALSWTVQGEVQKGLNSYRRLPEALKNFTPG